MEEDKRNESPAANGRSRRTFCSERGRLYFSSQAERRIFFYLTVILLAVGGWYWVAGV